MAIKIQKLKNLHKTKKIVEPYSKRFDIDVIQEFNGSNKAKIAIKNGIIDAYTGEELVGKRYKNVWNSFGGFLNKGTYDTLKKYPKTVSIFALTRHMIDDICSDLENGCSGIEIREAYHISQKVLMACRHLSDDFHPK